MNRTVTEITLSPKGSHPMYDERRTVIALEYDDEDQNKPILVLKQECGHIDVSIEELREIIACAEVIMMQRGVATNGPE